MSGAEKALAAGGIGALATMLGAPQAEAAPVISNGGIGSTVLTNPDATSGTFRMVVLYMDPIIGNSSDFAIRASGPEFFIYMQHDLSFAAAGISLAQRFASTDSIAGHALWAGSSTYGLLFNYAGGTGWTGSWQNGQGYIGVRISDGGGGYTYGWVLVTPNAAGTTLTINNWSTAAASGGAGGGTDSASGTPEPAAAGLGLLALGAAGVLRHKRHRKEEAA